MNPGRGFSNSRYELVRLGIAVLLSTFHRQRSLQWFRAEPEEQRQRDITLYNHLLDDVKKRMTDGTIPDCLASQTVTNQPKNGMSDVDIAYAVSSPFGAGIETVCSIFTHLSETTPKLLYNCRLPGRSAFSSVSISLSLFHFAKVLTYARSCDVTLPGNHAKGSS